MPTNMTLKDLAMLLKTYEHKFSTLTWAIPYSSENLAYYIVKILPPIL